MSFGTFGALCHTVRLVHRFGTLSVFVDIPSSFFGTVGSFVVSFGTFGTVGTFGTPLAFGTLRTGSVFITYTRKKA